MKHLKTLAIGMSTVMWAGTTNAQEVHTCGTHIVRQQMIEQDPSFLEREAALNEEIRQLILNNAVQRDEDYVITIPIVFHVLHLKGTENITDEQIFSAVDDLNDDFNAQNNDLSIVIPEFEPIIGNAMVEFKLATKDQFGNCTNGIERIQSVQTFLGEATSKGSQWPRNHYLNVWVCRNLPPGVAGYVNPPGSTEGFSEYLDGAMMLASYTGSTGISNSGARHTLPHEMGHMFSLSHVWGGTNEPGVQCGDDGVEDTPITKGNSGGCPTPAASRVCDPDIVENYQNIMDYSSCPRMFTMGQVERMRALLNTTSAERNSLWTSENLVFTGVAEGTEATCPPQADFYAVVGANVNQPTIPFTPTTCTNTTVKFMDNSGRSFATEWSWTFQDGTPSTSNVKNPTVEFSSPGWKSVSLTVSNAYGSTSKTDEYAVLVGSVDESFNGAYYEGFEGSDGIFPFIEGNYDLNFTHWQRFTGGGYNSNACVRLNSGDRNQLNIINTTNASDIDDLITPNLNISGLSGAQLSFWYSYNTTTTVLDDVTEQLVVYSSTDCGRTWQQRTAISGANLITSGTASGPGPWVFRSINLPGSLITENVRFRFRYTSSAFSGDLYLDDIQVGGPVGIDAMSGMNPMHIYPNPSNDLFNIQVNGMDVMPTELIIQDLRGAVVYRNIYAPSGEMGVELSSKAMGLAEGMYLLRASNDLGNSAQKLIVGR